MVVEVYVVDGLVFVEGGIDGVEEFESGIVELLG